MGKGVNANTWATAITAPGESRRSHWPPGLRIGDLTGNGAPEHGRATMNAHNTFFGISREIICA